MTYKITLFEREAELGGRVKSMTSPDYAFGPLEVGASGFSEDDLNLNRIIESVGLQQDVTSVHCPNDSAIWNGRQLVATVPTRTSTWRDWGRMTKLYGLSFVQSKRLIKDTLSKLRCLSNAIPIYDVYRSMEQLGAETSLWWTPSAYLRSKWISGRFVDEYASASIRASFGQSVLDTNAYYLALALASLPEEPLRLKGGNCELIEKMVFASLAEVHYSQEVTEIRTGANGSVQLRSCSTLKGDIEDIEMSFDSVIIAAPWASTGISMPELTIPPALVEYTSVHVTHFATPLDLNPEAFNLGDDDSLPEDIMTMPLDLPNSTSGTTTLDFFRLTKTRPPVRSKSAEDHRLRFNLYRLLTPERPTADQLLGLLKKSQDPNTNPLPWQHTQHWPFAWPRADYEQSPYLAQIADSTYSTTNIELIGSRLEVAVTMGMNIAEIVDGELRRQVRTANLPMGPIDLDE